MSSLTFERLNPQGNSPDAVIYIKDRSLLQHGDRFYHLHDFTIPPEASVEARFSDFNNLLFLTIRLNNEIVIYKDCVPRFFPDEAQQERLTGIFQAHGLAMIEAVKKVRESITHLKGVIDQHRSELSDVIPGLDPDHLDVDRYFFTTGDCELTGVKRLERCARDMMANARCLATAEPFAAEKRRKLE